MKIFLSGFVSIIVLVVSLIAYGYFKAQSLDNRDMINELSYNMVIIEMNPISTIGFDMYIDLTDRKNQETAFSKILEEYGDKTSY